MNKTQRIAKLNDQLRFRLHASTIHMAEEIPNGEHDNAHVTIGVHSLGQDFTAEALRSVAQFSDFSNDNDPDGEHDFGSVTVQEKTVFWKIDYYDPTKEWGSDDPSDTAATARVLTIMLSEEY